MKTGASTSATTNGGTALEVSDLQFDVYWSSNEYDGNDALFFEIFDFNKVFYNTMVSMLG